MTAVFYYSQRWLPESNTRRGWHVIDEPFTLSMQGPEVRTDPPLRHPCSSWRVWVHLTFFRQHNLLRHRYNCSIDSKDCSENTHTDNIQNQAATTWVSEHWKHRVAQGNTRSSAIGSKEPATRLPNLLSNPPQARRPHTLFYINPWRSPI